MISPKLAVLVTAFALVGTMTVPTTAFAQDDFSQNAEVEIERNNEIEQSIEQSQEACTNEAEVELSDDDVIGIGGENEVEVDQENECIVDQSQEATNTAAIVDDSENTFDVQAILATGGCPAQFENCSQEEFNEISQCFFTSEFLQEFCESFG